MKRALLCLACGLALVSPAFAQGIVSPRISGNEVLATIELPGGISADLSIAFEKVVGLNLGTLGLSAQLVSPSDLSLLNRLPGGGLASIPAAFPVLVRVVPTATSTLSFEGVYALGLHTHNLVFVPNTPLRLFTAHAGGAFRDITETMGVGSYRVRGSGGSFSEFLIVVDLRLLTSVISAKFDDVQSLLDQNAAAIASSVLTDLRATLAAARASYDGGNVLDAMTKVEQFLAAVKAHSGSDIPNVWRANDSRVNVAGELRAAASTLLFSLNLKSNETS